MRALVDARRVERFLEALGAAARSPARVYLTGGATAVLEGWRDTRECRSRAIVMFSEIW